jgi:hypothetical protein
VIEYIRVASLSLFLESGSDSSKTGQGIKTLH